MNGFLCLGGNVFEFDGWRFEWHGYHGPWPLAPDSDTPLDIDLPEDHEFWRMIRRFQALTPEEQAKHLVVEGGCVAF